MRIDARGEICPYPATVAVQAMQKVVGDEAIEVLIDHAPALETVPWQAQRLGFEATIEELGSAEWKITLRRTAPARS